MAFTDEESLTRYASAAGLPPIGGGGRSATRPSAATAPATAPRPQPLGTRAGAAARDTLRSVATGARQVASAGLSTAQGMVNNATYPVRAAGGIARDAGNALLGREPSPNAGQPLGGVDFRKPLVSTPLRADFSDVRSSSSTAPAPAARPRPTAAPAPAQVAPVANMTTLDGRPGGLASAVDPSTGARIYDNASIARLQQQRPSIAAPSPAAAAVPSPAATAQIGSAPAPAPAAIAPRPVPVAVAAPRSNAGDFAPRGRQGGIIENPNDTTLDKLERALTTGAARGSPGNRRMLAEAILGEAAGRRDERAGALRTQDQADLANVQNGAQAAEANSQRRFSADQFNANAVLEQQNLESRERIARRPQVTIAENGGLGLVSDDARFTPVTGADGRPVRAPRPANPNSLTADDLLKAYSDQRKAITESATMDPKDKQSALAQLDNDPLFAPIRSSATGPSAQDLELLRSNPQLSAQFDEQFGTGASQRYLTP